MALLVACSSSTKTKENTYNATRPIEVHGHRGARSIQPENTLPAFAYALDVGVDVLELDLAVTQDNQLVLSHNPHLEPELCLGPDGKKLKKPVLIRSLTLAQVQRHDCGSLQNPKFPKQTAVPRTPPPTLRQVFDLVLKRPGPERDLVRFNIETKIRPDQPNNTVGPKTFAKLVVEELRRNRMLKRSILQSFDFRTLTEARKLEPNLTLAALVEDPRIDLIELAQTLQPEIISPYHKLIDGETMQTLRAEGVKVIPWTANEPEIWDRLLEIGVDGIITDDPAALIEHLKKL